MKQEIKIVSLPRLKRFGINPEDRYSKRQHHIFRVDRFTCLENRFTHHPDGGEAMYKKWLAAQLSDYEDVYQEISRMYSKYHHSEREVTLIFLVDTETPPIHAKIIRDFIMSAGAKL